jgi:hypothetical protein
MQGPTSKKTNEPHKRVNHKGIVKFPNPLQLQEAYQIRKGGGPAERGQGKFFYGNSNISPFKNTIFKKSSERNQNPLRYYNSITNLKFQHKPKYHLSKILL